MKHTWVIVAAVGAVLIYFLWRWSGAAANCSFLDAIMGKCGVTASS